MASPNLAAWLRSHDLGAYIEAFARNEITLPDLRLLSDADLRELGLPMGPRKRLLAALAPSTVAVTTDTATATASIEEPAAATDQAPHVNVAGRATLGVQAPRKLAAATRPRP